MSPLFSQSKLRGRLVQYNGEFMTLVVYKNWLCCFAFRPKPGSVVPFVAALFSGPNDHLLICLFHRSPPLYTWSQDFFGINLQSYIWLSVYLYFCRTNNHFCDIFVSSRIILIEKEHHAHHCYHPELMRGSVPWALVRNYSNYPTRSIGRPEKKALIVIPPLPCINHQSGSGVRMIGRTKHCRRISPSN